MWKTPAVSDRGGPQAAPTRKATVPQSSEWLSDSNSPAKCKPAATKRNVSSNKKSCKAQHPLCLNGGDKISPIDGDNDVRATGS